MFAAGCIGPRPTTPEWVECPGCGGTTESRGRCTHCGSRARETIPARGPDPRLPADYVRPNCHRGRKPGQKPRAYLMPGGGPETR